MRNIFLNLLRHNIIKTKSLKTSIIHGVKTLPKVKIALRRGVTVDQHIRAGVTVYQGEPQEHEVTDEQLAQLLDDPAFEIDERDIVADENTGGEGDKKPETTKDPSDDERSQETAENSEKEETEPAVDETLGDETPAAGENDTPIGPGDEEEKGDESDEKTEDEEPADDFPTEANAIKRLKKDAIVAKAQELGIEANYDPETGATKGELAELIVAKLKG